MCARPTACIFAVALAVAGRGAGAAKMAEQDACAAGDSDGCRAADGSTFGRALRARFNLADGFTNFNHGSFGAVPKDVSAAQHKYLLQCEARPDRWFRQDYFACVDEARRKLAAYINAPSVDDVVMVENASGGVNAVMRSMNWADGGVILYLSSAYAMVKHTAEWLAATDAAGRVRNIEVQLGADFPMAGDASVLAPLKAALAEHAGTIRLLVISHITSVPAVTLPVAEILALARAAGDIAVLVDGAHALGQVDIDLQAMGDPDFYVSNAHKWLYAPKGAAFLYVRKDRQLPHFPEPSVISSSGKRVCVCVCPHAHPSGLCGPFQLHWVPGLHPLLRGSRCLCVSRHSRRAFYPVCSRALAPPTLSPRVRAHTHAHARTKLTPAHAGNTSRGWHRGRENI